MDGEWTGEWEGQAALGHFSFITSYDPMKHLETLSGVVRIDSFAQSNASPNSYEEYGPFAERTCT
jgi:hypothetical protein